MDIDWTGVKRVLVVRLRSIGDAVLATPSLAALRRQLPTAQIDILLEDWVAALLEGFDAVDNVIAVGRSGLERMRTARRLRRTRYDVVFNLHGGTTSTFFTRATGARHRVGYANYQYANFYTDLLSSSADFWGRTPTHSAEQQLALLGFVGIPVEDRPTSRLPIPDVALRSIEQRLANSGFRIPHPEFALLHPSTAFITKQWPAENFARLAEHLGEKGLAAVAVTSKSERAVLEELVARSGVPVTTFDDLSLPEITALASRAKLFVGNDSGIAHISAAVGTPTLVIFGSSNRDHWRPWGDAPSEIVFEEFDCQPCPGYRCEVFGEPRCILSIAPERVIAAAERLIEKTDQTAEML
ncbi:MAG: glycosyltransferase family 9 protein [Acidobacteria bacterium]|nr:glycosyltransferase family 9 protein [Acidobacteriota bacterium]